MCCFHSRIKEKAGTEKMVQDKGKGGRKVNMKTA
jgi:hypothetical protein